MHVTIPIPAGNDERRRALAALVERQRAQGGAIIQYARVWSALVVCMQTPCFEWVPPRASRVRAGLRHTLFTACLGWWSLAGFFGTLAALILNLRGGIDVTPLFTGPAPGSEQAAQQRELAVRAMQKAARNQQLAFLAAVLLILAALVVFLVIPALPGAHRR